MDEKLKKLYCERVGNLAHLVWGVIVAGALVAESTADMVGLGQVAAGAETLFDVASSLPVLLSVVAAKPITETIMGID